MGSILIVRRIDLIHTPVGFQQYVRDHFKERELLGVPVYIASERLEWGCEDEEAWKRGRMRGIAPSASWCGSRYDAGLSVGQRLCDWIRANLDGYVTRLTAAGERETDFWDDD